jgi:hypothetical protein
MTFLKGYTAEEINSEDIFRGIAYFFRFFALKTFLSYLPLKVVWADPPTPVSVRVKEK